MILPPHPCDVCRRATDGTSISIPGQPPTAFCSVECARAYMRHGAKTLDCSEEQAALKGGEAAGAYLDEIGVFDLREMTESQWREFCGRLFKGACDELARLADDEIPF